MEKQLLLAIDAGTTGIRTILYDRRGQEVARSYREFRQITPAPGLLEHDPMEIWEVTRGLMQETLQKARIEPADVAAIGVTGQRATTLVWDRATGQPLYNALVWQDLRTYRRCMELSQALGFTVSPIASLTKMEWLLQNVPGAREKVAEGEALVGTLDTWLIWKLTAGKAFVTDPSNACTTLLWDPGTGDWNPRLAGLAGVPVEALAKVSPSSGVYGETASAVFGAPVPVAAVAGDQQAAMFGQLCVAPGEGKATYGTSVMVDVNTGSNWLPVEGAYPLALWRMGGHDLFCLEGTVITGGASVGWARDMRLLDSPQESSALAAQVPDSGGVFFVPALQGLGTPYMDHAVKGGLVGLTRATTRAHVARALLEGIAFRTRQVVESLRALSPVPSFPSLRVDGGMAENDLFLQIQADVLGVPVERPATSQVTALGIASMAGLAVGYWNSVDELRATRAPGLTFLPGEGAAALQERFAVWQEAVEALRSLAGRTAR
ncbi:MAG: FGGY family carbohydrate kinase [Bacillota bacterium]